MEIQRSNFVKANEILDFIPVVSTVTNLIILIAKGILSTAVALGADRDSLLKDRNWLAYIDNKSLSLISVLMFPILNILVAYREWEKHDVTTSKATGDFITAYHEMKEQYEEIKKKEIFDLSDLKYLLERIEVMWSFPCDLNLNRGDTHFLQNLGNFLEPLQPTRNRISAEVNITKDNRRKKFTEEDRTAAEENQCTLIKTDLEAFFASMEALNEPLLKKDIAADES